MKWNTYLLHNALSTPPWSTMYKKTKKKRILLRLLLYYYILLLLLLLLLLFPPKSITTAQLSKERLKTRFIKENQFQKKCVLLPPLIRRGEKTKRKTEITNPRNMNYEKKKRFNETKDDKTKVTFITTTTATRNNWRFCDWFDKKLEITNKLLKKKKLKKTQLKNKEKIIRILTSR